MTTSSLATATPVSPSPPARPPVPLPDASTAPAASHAATASLPASTRSYRVRRGDGIDGLRLSTEPLAAPTGRDVVVRIHAVALNYRDLMTVRGDAGPADRWLVPGSDAAGEVIAVGPEVTTFAVGDHVVSAFFPDWIAGEPTPSATAGALGGTLDGVLAEHVRSPQDAWVPMPAGLDFVEAATLSCAGVTAWNALFHASALTPGDSVLLLGTGGVSLWALQLAKAAGRQVIITSSDDDKLARARALGADATINYRRTPEWQVEARRLSGDRGVGAVLEVGGPDTLARSIEATRMGGSIAVIGRLTGTAAVAFDPVALFSGSRRMVGVMVGSQSMLRALSHFVELHRIRPVIDRVFEFEQLGEAYRWLEGARHFGKVVVRVAGG